MYKLFINSCIHCLHSSYIDIYKNRTTKKYEERELTNTHGTFSLKPL